MTHEPASDVLFPAHGRHEDHVHEKVGGVQGFKVKNIQFDGAYGVEECIWYEAKAGWHYIVSSKEELMSFKSKAPKARGVANEYGCEFIIVSKVEIPKIIKDFLREKNIGYKEFFYE